MNLVMVVVQERDERIQGRRATSKSVDNSNNALMMMVRREFIETPSCRQVDY